MAAGNDLLTLPTYSHQKIKSLSRRSSKRTSKLSDWIATQSKSSSEPRYALSSLARQPVFSIQFRKLAVSRGCGLW